MSTSLLLLGVGAASVLVLGIGVVLLVVGARQRFSAGDWWRTSVETTGVVVSSRMVTFGEGQFGSDVDSGGAVMLPTVRFSLPDGQEIVAESAQGHNFTARNGKTVPVHYQPSDPTRPWVGRQNIAKTNGCVMQVMGAGLLLMGLMLLGFFAVLALITSSSP